MLRYAFFPDFHCGPKLLLWIGFCSAAGDTVIVMPQKRNRGGVTRVRGEEKAFRWELDRSSAEWFAELIDVLAEPSSRGHQYLEHLRSSSNIVVMASCGEYPDNLRQP